MEEKGASPNLKIAHLQYWGFQVQIELSDGHDDRESRHAIFTKLNNLNTQRSVQFDLSEFSMPLQLVRYLVKTHLRLTISP